MKPKKEWTEEEKLWAKEGIIFVIGVWVVIIFDFILLEYFLRSMLNLYPGAMSLFAGIKIILAVLYVIGFLPVAVLAELADSRVKRRFFRPRNILIFLLIFGEAILIAEVLLTLFDIFFSESSVLFQVPLVAVSASVPSLIVVATSRIKRIRDYVEKAFK